MPPQEVYDAAKIIATRDQELLWGDCIDRVYTERIKSDRINLAWNKHSYTFFHRDEYLHKLSLLHNLWGNKL